MCSIKSISSSITPVVSQPKTASVSKPVPSKPESLEVISKEKFDTIGKKVSGGETTLLNKLKEIDPKKDFSKILSKDGKISLTKEQASSLKEFLYDNAMDTKIKAKRDDKGNRVDDSEIKELKKDKHVTKDTTKKQITLADGTKTTVMTGNVGSKIAELEKKLINPTSTDDRERLGIAARQKKIMEAAKKADPLMAQIEKTGSLASTHTKANETLENTGTKKKPVFEPKTGDSWDKSGKLIDSKGKQKYSYGAEEFGNREIRKIADETFTIKEPVLDKKTGKPQTDPKTKAPITVDKVVTIKSNVETTVPELQNKPGTVASKGDGVKARKGVWSEADINPREKSSTNAAKGRDAERLLFTHKDSEVSEQVSTTKKQPSKKVEFKYHVTTDHYQTSVPIAPVATNYKASMKDPYKPKYDKKGNEIDYSKKTEDPKKTEATKVVEPTKKPEPPKVEEPKKTAPPLTWAQRASGGKK
jgi:hypothetical protein